MRMTSRRAIALLGSLLRCLVAGLRIRRAGAPPAAPPARSRSRAELGLLPPATPADLPHGLVLSLAQFATEGRQVGARRRAARVPATAAAAPGR